MGKNFHRLENEICDISWSPLIFIIQMKRLSTMKMSEIFKAFFLPNGNIDNIRLLLVDFFH